MTPSAKNRVTMLVVNVLGLAAVTAAVLGLMATSIPHEPVGYWVVTVTVALALCVMLWDTWRRDHLR